MKNITRVANAEMLQAKTVWPKVISASRATDIPAFHARWFMDRLREGKCAWQNPFNANQRQVVAFDKAELIVFWSKNPAPLMPYLNELRELGKKCYFQFTLNVYEMEGLEPGLPKLEARIATFLKLAQDYKVIWRYDPIILGETLTVRRHLQIVEKLMKCLADSPEKLVFSFVDLYSRVATNLGRTNKDLRSPTSDEMRKFSQELCELRDKMAPRLRLATCAETDLESLGIEKNKCIDPELINRLCGREIYKGKSSLLGISYEKDKGQRDACGCAPSKDIGSYRSHACGHHCIYCYAGHAAKS